MTRWVKDAEKVVMIDGCFLKCHGRVLNKLIGAESVVQFDALPFYKKRNGLGERNAAEPAASAGAL